MAGHAGSLVRGGPHRPLRVRIRELLESRILDGEYRPGDKLVEYRIARELGVSQAPVREALRDLAGMGLVEVREHVGTRVRDIEPHEDQAVGRVRVTLEAEAAKLAARRLPHHPEELAVLRARLAELRRAAEAGDTLAVARAGVAFHRAVIEAAGQPVLLDVWNALGIELRTAVAVRDGRMSLAETAAGHQPILDALAAGDARTASRLARDHARTWLAQRTRHRPRRSGSGDPPPDADDAR